MSARPRKVPGNCLAPPASMWIWLFWIWAALCSSSSGTRISQGPFWFRTRSLMPERWKSSKPCLPFSRTTLWWTGPICLPTLIRPFYDASGTILPIKDAPQRAFLAEFNSHIQPRVVGDETFSTVVLTLDGKVALLQDFPTPEKNGALLVEIHEDVLLHFLEQSLGRYRCLYGNFGPIGCSHLLRRQLSLGDPGGNPLQDMLAGAFSSGRTRLRPSSPS